MGQRRVKPGQCCVKAGKAGLAGNGCHETKTRVESTVARGDPPRSNDSTIQDKAVAALRGRKRRRRPFRRPGQGRRGMYPGLTQVTRGMLMTGQTLAVRIDLAVGGADTNMGLPAGCRRSSPARGEACPAANCSRKRGLFNSRAWRPVPYIFMASWPSPDTAERQSYLDGRSHGATPQGS